MRNSSTHKILILSAVALAGWMGCQTSPDQSSSTSDAALSRGGELFLEVKASDTCTALQAALVSGSAADSAAFAAQCIVEVATSPVPPAVAPDSGLRCKWIRARIDSGDANMIPFARAERRICDNLKTADTASFAKYCKLPPPPPPPVQRAKCDSLKATLDATLDATDTSSTDFLRLRHELAQKCKLPPPPPRPKK